MSTGPDWSDTTLTSEVTPRSYAAAEAGRGTSWVLFAGIMLATVAILNVIWGIAAIAKSSYFVTDASYILLTDLRAWGFVVLAIGAVEFFAAFSIWRGDGFGRWLGIGVGRARHRQRALVRARRPAVVAGRRRSGDPRDLRPRRLRRPAGAHGVGDPRGFQANVMKEEP